MSLTIVGLLLALGQVAPDVDLAGSQIVVVPKATDIEVFAARDLARYLRVMCGKESLVTLAENTDKPGPAIFLGSIESGFPATVIPGDLDEQGYVVQVTSANPARLIVAGKTPIGVQYGVYSLLERLGMGFYLGGDAFPEQRSQLLVPADLKLRGAPAFRIRGSLPWYNFLNSPTTWDLEDFQYFFDQMAKMKYNFVGFHSYDSEPFCAYPLDDQWHDAVPAATSLTYGWGTIRGMKTPEFGFGTGRYFFDELFGSRSVTGAAAVGVAEGEKVTAWPDVTRRTKDQDAVFRAQCSLAQGLDYARKRGLHVCVGYELQGDPTNPETRRHAEARIRNTLATYPMADYIWFWQQEGAGGGSAVPALGTPLRLLCDEYAPMFAYLEKPERIYEAARMTAYVQFAYDVVRRINPTIGIAVSGWGGDAWMRFSDFYVGLDKLVPKDIIFAALDNIDPSKEDHVSAAYGKLSPERQRWPIPWWQSDGGGTRRDQWGPQTNAKPYTALLRDALAKQCQGVLSIHWEIRGVEEVAAYMAQFAWEPTLTYEDFYRRFADRCFGAQNAAEMAQLLMDLEALGPRWTGGPGQVECGGFTWFSDDRRPKEENLAKLREIRAKLETIRAACAHDQVRIHLERLNYLIATMDWLVNFDHAAVLLTPGGEVDKALAAAEIAKKEGAAEKAKSEAKRAVDLLRDCGLREAMQSFPTRLNTQGDWGNLATINIKAYAMFEQTLARVKALLGEIPAELTGTPPPKAPVLKMRTPPGALPEKTPFTVRAVAFDDSGIKEVSVVYRQTGEAETKQVVMQHAWGDSYVGAIPGDAIGDRGIEFFVKAEASDGGIVTLPLGPEGASFTASALPTSGPRVYGPWIHGKMAFAPARTQDAMFVRGVGISDVEYDALKCELALGDAPVTTGLRLAYDLIFYGMPGVTGAAKTSGTLTISDGAGRKTIGKQMPLTLISEETPGTPREVKAEVIDAFLVRLTWEAADGAAEYEVHRSEQANFQPDEKTLLARWPWRTYIDAQVKPRTTYHYAVLAVNDVERKGGGCFAAPLAMKDFPLPAAPANVKATPGIGRVTLQWDAVSRNCAGYVVLKGRDDKWDLVSGEHPLGETTYTVGGLDAANELRFRVVTVDRAGRRGEPSAEVAATPVAPPREPVLAISFKDMKAETGQAGTLLEHATVHDGVLDLREGGWMSFANAPALQLSGGMTVEFWASIDKVEGMPVLLSYGHFDGPGYWVQLFGNGIRWYVSRGCILDAGKLPTGGWHYVVATYDETTSRLYVDGTELGNAAVGQADLTAWSGELRIGQYSDISAPFQTYGQMDDVRIYQRVLSAEEIRASFERGRSTP